MFNAVIKTATKTINIPFNSPALISDILEQGGFYMQKPCGGTGKCGKCKVRVSGILSELLDKEKTQLTQKEISGGIRLACLTYAKSNITIYYDEHKTHGLTEGKEPDFIPDPILKKKVGFGCAIDIGTTTVAAYIYKFPECECVKSFCLTNTQAKFGADVISRMELCKNEDGLKKLYNEIQQIFYKIQNSIDESIDTYVIVGNTTMMHIFCKISPYSMAFSPFEPKTLFGHFHNNIYLPKCVSAFIGSDVISAALASEIYKKSKVILLDIGTNGEIILKNGDKYVCTSAAAGPAFEGADIEMGMTASTGAISKVWIENKCIKYEVVENTEAIGICGTGLLDAVAAMLDLNLLDSNGYIENDFYIGNSNVKITQKDIRQIQLAKSAIRSGLDILLESENLTYEEIEQLYLAGGFGSYINKYSAARIGLIPEELVDKTIAIGNGAGIGATMILRSKEFLNLSEKIADSAQTINLNNETIFQQKFIDNMSF